MLSALEKAPKTTTSLEIPSQEPMFSLAGIIIDLKKMGLDLEKGLDIILSNSPANVRSDLDRIDNINIIARKLKARYSEVYNDVLRLLSLLDFDSKALQNVEANVQVLDDNEVIKTIKYTEDSQLVYSRASLVRALGDLSKINLEILAQIPENIKTETNQQNLTIDFSPDDLIPPSDIKMGLVDIVGMSKMPKKVGDVAINKLIKYLNNQAELFSEHYPDFKFYIHRYGGDEFQIYVRSVKNDYNELDKVYGQFKAACLNTDNPENNHKAEYILPIETYVNVENRSDLTTQTDLKIRCEDVYQPDARDVVGRLIWQRYVQQGLFLPAKEIIKLKSHLLGQPKSKELLQELILEIKLYQQNLKPFGLEQKDKNPNAELIASKMAEIVRGYPFLTSFFDEIFLLETQVFGCNEDGLLNDSIILERLIAGIMRTGINPLLGNINFPEIFLKWLKQTDPKQRGVEFYLENKFKPINDVCHTTGDEIIRQSAIRWLKEMFREFRHANPEEQARIDQLEKDKHSLPIDYIPVEFRPYLILTQDGGSIKLTLSKHNYQPTDLKNSAEISHQLLKWIVSTVDSDISKMPIVLEDQCVNIFSNATLVNPNVAFFELKKFGFIRAEDQSISFEQDDLNHRHADLKYIIKLVQEFTNLDQPKLNCILNNILTNQIQNNNDEVVFTDGTQKFLLSTWMDKKRGIGNCDKYLKVLNTLIPLETDLEKKAKLESLKTFFVLMRNPQVQRKTNQ